MRSFYNIAGHSICVTTSKYASELTIATPKTRSKNSLYFVLTLAIYCSKLFSVSCVIFAVSRLILMDENCENYLSVVLICVK